MPLRFKCSHCAKELLLDEAFRGAGCRCQFCRGYMRIPAAQSTRPAQRPLRPPLMSERPATSPAARTSGVTRSDVSAGHSSRYSRFNKKRFVIVAATLLGACTIGLTALAFSNSASRTHNRLIAIAPADRTTPSQDAGLSPTAAPKPADLRTSYFGLPVDGNVVAYVVDADPAISPYIEQLSMATNLVNQGIKSETRRYGIARPEYRNRPSLLGLTTRSPMLEGGETSLSPQIPAQRTDLNEALAVASNWYADQIFMVLAKPLDPAEIQALAQSAEQTGAKTNVIALGPAAKQDLSPIAKATGGEFIALTDAQWADWAAQYKAVAASHE